MTDLQPPPLECQWCGKDLAIEPHGRACRIVTNDDGLDIPEFLKREKKDGSPT